MRNGLEHLKERVLREHVAMHVNVPPAMVRGHGMSECFADLRWRGGWQLDADLRYRRDVVKHV